MATGDERWILRPPYLTIRRVLVVSLLFLILEQGFPYLEDFLDDCVQPYRATVEGSLITQAWDAAYIAEGLNVVDVRAVLISVLLICIVVDLQASPRDRRKQDSALFTVIVNCHILLIAMRLPFSSHKDTVLLNLVLGAGLVGHILRTASWCLIAFFLLEGRLWLPFVGMFSGKAMSVVFSVAFTGPFWPYLHNVSEPVGALAEFCCLVVLFYQTGHRLDLFPGLSRRRFWYYLKCLAAISTFHMIWDNVTWLMLSADSAFEIWFFSRVLDIRGGNLIGMAIVYLLPVAFFMARFVDFGRWSTRVTLCLWLVVTLFDLGAYVAVQVLPHALFHWPLGDDGEFGYLRFPLFILAAGWNVLLPVPAVRWWSSGRLIRPVLIAGVAWMVALIGVVIEAGLWFPSEPDDIFLPSGARELVAAYLVATILTSAFLLRPLPPVKRLASLREVRKKPSAEPCPDIDHTPED
jgi:hypothetical protein